MGNFIGGIAGAAIGFAIGGPAGAVYGFGIGGAAGSALFPPSGSNMSGPRMTNVQFQSADEGTMIPIVYGCARTSGALVWKGPLIAVEREEGGKGGPTYTTTDYYISFLVTIAEAPGNILRVWANDKLIYDGRSAADKKDSVVLDPNSADYSFFDVAKAVAAGLLDGIYGTYHFFDGNPDQQPPGFVEAVEGVGNVPAYRGVVQFGVERMPLEDFGNGIPNITAEVCRCCNGAQSEIVGPPDSVLDPGESFEFTHTGAGECAAKWTIIGGDNDGEEHYGDTFLVTAPEVQDDGCTKNFCVDLNDGCDILCIGISNNPGLYSGKIAVRGPKRIANEDQDNCFTGNASQKSWDCVGVMTVRTLPQVNQSLIDSEDRFIPPDEVDAPAKVGPNGCSGTDIGPETFRPTTCLGIGRWCQCNRYGYWPFAGGWQQWSTATLGSAYAKNIRNGWFPGDYMDARSDAMRTGGDCCPPQIALIPAPNLGAEFESTDVSVRGEKYWDDPTVLDDGLSSADIAGNFLCGREPGDPFENLPLESLGGGW